MKVKLLLVGCGLLYAANASAQCNLHKKKDEYSGKTSMWTDKIRITKGGAPLLVKAVGGDDDCSYRIYFRLLNNNGKVSISLSEDADNCYCTISAISLKCKDGTSIIKSKGKVGESVKTTLGFEQFTFFGLTREELTQLSKSEIVKFRVTENGCSDHVVINDELEDKEAGKMKDDAACMLKELPGN